MRILVTGATGFVGLDLCRRLVDRGDEVRGLCRSPDRAGRLAAWGVEVWPGSLSEGIGEAATGCDAVIHLAALAAVWSPEPDAFRRVNVEGTRRVLDAAEAAGVARVVHTSTAAVLGPSDGAPVNEATARRAPWFSPYEQTKAEAEALVCERVSGGLDAVIVNPTRVYGPTERRPMPPMNRLVEHYLAGTWRWLPGDGSGAGNYVTVDDVSDGILRALDRGRRGERYVIGGENATFAELFATLGRVTGRPRRLVPVPRAVLTAGARAATAWAGLTGTAPLITPGWVHRFLLDWRMSSDKAAEELGYRPSTLARGLARTVAWLRTGEA